MDTDEVDERRELVSVFVQGDPRSKAFHHARRKDGRPFSLDSDTSRSWQKTIAEVVRYCGRSEMCPPGAAIELSLEFLLRRQKGEIGQEEVDGQLLAARRKGKIDIDKLERAVLDALTGVIYKDDSQVTRVVKIKRVCDADEVPGLHVSAWSRQ